MDELSQTFRVIWLTKLYDDNLIWCQRPSTVGRWHYVDDMIKHSTSIHFQRFLNLKNLWKQNTMKTPWPGNSCWSCSICKIEGRVSFYMMTIWKFEGGCYATWWQFDMMSATIDCWSLTSYWWHDQTFNLNTFLEVSQFQKPLETEHHENTMTWKLS